jgi:hypothetical protein
MQQFMYECKRNKNVSVISEHISTITLVPMRSHKKTNVIVIAGVPKILSLEGERPLFNLHSFQSNRIIWTYSKYFVFLCVR